MGILSGPEILRQIHLGKIKIIPFNSNRLGPNSYDVSLAPLLRRVTDTEFDITKKVVHIEDIPIPKEGYVLQPSLGYLGSVVEFISCEGFVPWIDGRSTTGRYFLQAHQTAGRGDDGWSGQFTLELLATYRPVRVYTGIPIAQVFFFTLEGERSPYKGRYQNQAGPTLPKPIHRQFFG